MIVIIQSRGTTLSVTQPQMVQHHYRNNVENKKDRLYRREGMEKPRDVGERNRKGH